MTVCFKDLLVALLPSYLLTFFNIGEIEEKSEYPRATRELVVLFTGVMVHHVLLTQLVPRNTSTIRGRRD